MNLAGEGLAASGDQLVERYRSDTLSPDFSRWMSKHTMEFRKFPSPQHSWRAHAALSAQPLLARRWRVQASMSANSSGELPA